MSQLVRIGAAQLKKVKVILNTQQGGLCSVCGKPFTERDIAVLDHDHHSGIIRGLLHISCNSVEGQILTKANRCHKGVSGYDYLVGLGNYLAYHATPRTHMIHPSHHMPNERANVPKRKRNWRT